MSAHVIITAQTLGRDDDELGGRLMLSFVHSLAAANERPLSIFLLNGGVKLACAGSPALDDLAALAEHGVPVRACTTCLEHYDLLQDLRVGDASTMVTAVALMTGEDRVVTIG